MVDSLVVGNFVGADVLAAVGSCSHVNFLFFSLSSGLATGIGIIVAQYYGAGDEENVRVTISNSVYVLAGASVIVSILSIILAKPLLRLLQTPEGILNDSVIYMQTTCAGLLAIAAYNSLIAISGMMLQGVINRFGENVIAANTIIGRVEQVVQQPYGSLSAALTTYTGQNIGAGKHDRVKQGYRQSVIAVLIFSLCWIPVIFLFGEQIISFFVDDSEVIEIGIRALQINSFSYFALGMIYVPRSLLNGSGEYG